MTEKIKAVGSKAEVWHQTAKHTSGGLYKKDLMKHKGRIVSRKKHEQGKKAIKRLFALGYKPKKGTFKVMRKSMVDGRKHKGKRHTRKRGGYAESGTGLGAGVPKQLSATSGTGLAAGSKSS